MIFQLLEEDNPLAVNVKDIERRQVHLLQKNKKLEAVIQSFEDEVSVMSSFRFLMVLQKLGIKR